MNAQPVVIPAIITDIVLKNFKYLDASMKRESFFFFSLFSNENLTQKIENVAKEFIGAVEKLSNSKNMTKEGIFSELISLMCTAILKVQALRNTESRSIKVIKKDRGFALNEEDKIYRKVRETTIKKGYDKGTFEKNMLLAIKALSKEALNDSLKERCEILKNAIVKFTPRIEESVSDYYLKTTMTF